MQAAEPGIGVSGNKEVVDFLEQTLARAKGGKMNFVAVVTADSSTEVVHSHIGVFESHFAAITGVECLKLDLLAAIQNRQVPPHDATIPANLVCYDLAVEPANFDFPCWLAYAHMQMVKEGVEGPLRVGFLDAREEDDTPENAAKRRRMFENVLLPLVDMFGAVHDDEAAVSGRRYNTYALKPIVEAYKKGERLPTFKPKIEAQFHGNPPVTITLREADHWPHRNSNLSAWFDFARYLEAKGERVIFVRDSAKADEPLTCYGDFTTYKPAAVDLNARLALYEAAKCNLFVSNGPWMLALFGKVPWQMFVRVALDEPYHANLPNWWRKHHGVAEGEQFPWATKHQRIVWKEDSYENLVEAWEQHGPR